MSEQNYLLLRKNILNLIKNNNISRSLNIRKKVDIDNEFAETKKNYNSVLEKRDLPYQLKEKYNLEYLFLFEQYNLKTLPIDYNTKKSELYNKRLENILIYVNAKKERTSAEAQSRLYSINSSVQDESIYLYDGKIDRLKQERIVNSKFKLYMDHIKETDYASYREREELYPNDEMMEELTLNIERLEQERELLKQVFREQKFQINENDVLELTDPDITQVLYSLYPDFKNKQLELNERLNDENKKGRQVA